MTDTRTKTDKATRWMVWHAGELTGIAVPLVLADTVTAWFALISATVAAGWVANEIRLARQRRAVAAGTAPAALLTTNTNTVTSGSTDKGSEASA
jgi:urea transporter